MEDVYKQAVLKELAICVIVCLVVVACEDGRRRQRGLGSLSCDLKALPAS
jgi:hypothetical protein